MKTLSWDDSVAKTYCEIPAMFGLEAPAQYRTIYCTISHDILEYYLYSSLIAFVAALEKYS